MPTFAQWEAQRKGQTLPQENVAANEGGQYHATLGDDYTSAAEHELLRTGKEAAIGLARSPLDMVKSLLHPLETLSGMGHAVMHPQETVKGLTKDPRAAGSLLGQMLLAPKVPGMAESAVAEGPGIVGRGLSAAGRGAEAVGTSRAMKAAGKLGVLESALRMDPKGIALAAAPKALELGGKGLQKVGGALEGLKLSLKRAPVVEDPLLDPEAATVRETVKTAQGYKDAGASPAQASARAGWPLGKSEDIPYRAGSGADVQGARGPDQSAANALLRGMRPAQDSSMAAQAAQPSLADISPVEKFYREDPQARIGGEGRMTGQFEEGAGGLSDLAAGKFGVRSPLDELAQLSKGVSSTRMHELLKKFGGAGS